MILVRFECPIVLTGSPCLLRGSPTLPRTAGVKSQHETGWSLTSAHGTSFFRLCSSHLRKLSTLARPLRCQLCTRTLSGKRDSFIRMWKPGWRTQEGSGPPRTVQEEGAGPDSPQPLLPPSGDSEDIWAETPVQGGVQGQERELSRVRRGRGSDLSGSK